MANGMWSQYYNLAERPPLPSFSHKLKMPCGQTLYVTVTCLDANTPVEVFLNIESPDSGIFNLLNVLKDDVSSVELDILGKINYCHKAAMESVGRLISNWLREGGDPYKIGKTLMGVRCAAIAPGGNSKTLSCQDAVGRMLYFNTWRPPTEGEKELKKQEEEG